MLVDVFQSCHWISSGKSSALEEIAFSFSGAGKQSIGHTMHYLCHLSGCRDPIANQRSTVSFLQILTDSPLAIPALHSYPKFLFSSSSSGPSLFAH
jgi:hypothetical protein